jgi:hypothetical protein
MSDPLKTAELILSLFRGRQDHVAVANGAAFGPQKLDRPMQPRWLAERHLAQQRCLGFYLMDEEGNVCCSCIDFDNKPDAPDVAWRDKATALYLWLQGAGLSPVLELSQSGTAAHVWLFLEAPTPAWLVRAFWRLASEKSGVEFVEVYPRQDFLSGKGLGNLVRYPLWNLGRFVDPEDEWKELDPEVFLPTVKQTAAWELKELAMRLGVAELKPEKQFHAGATAEATAPDGELPPRVQDRLKKTRSLLARRWEGDTTGLKDPSRSALVQSIACELVRQFVPTDEIAQAILVWGREHDFDKVHRQDWMARTVSKAYEFTFSRLEETSAGALQMRDACLAYIDTLERKGLVHIRSGLKELDLSIEGVAPGEMCIVAARPGHGKTAFGAQWLDVAAGDGLPCLLISEEMSAAELGKRVLKSISVTHHSQWRAETAPGLRSEVHDHYEGRAPFYLVENCNTAERAVDVIDQMCSLHGVRLVAVDYVQLLESRGRSRYEEITGISKQLKQAAKRNNCGLLALCQLNRDVDGRPDHEPRMSDLRDSGGLEQDADTILFLQWPWKYDPAMPENDYLIFAAKRRNGPIRQPKVATRFWPDQQLVRLESPVPGELPPGMDETLRGL